MRDVNFLGNDVLFSVSLGNEALIELFDHKMMQYVANPRDWKAVVSSGVNILVQNNYATAQLADAIFAATAQHGAYYVLEPGIALVHAPPGPYALKPGASVLLLAHNIQFNNQDKYARIIVTVVATDHNAHFKIIKQFGEIFMNQKLKQKLLKATSLAEFKEIIALERNK